MSQKPAARQPLEAPSRGRGPRLRRPDPDPDPDRRRYQRPSKGSAVDAVEVQIRELLRETPTMPAR
ncbi:hypothetical protein ACFYTG_48070 [Streptomyces mirabilis]|uniref:hypothetical protein n=1 Tax=Streptomyces mirabilis TaxID=68239 RepID=UPI0036ADDA4C